MTNVKHDRPRVHIRKRKLPEWDDCTNEEKREMNRRNTRNAIICLNAYEKHETARKLAEYYKQNEVITIGSVQVHVRKSKASER